MTDAKNRVIAVLNDLLFRVKIEQAAKSAGVETVFAEGQQDALMRAREQPAMVIVDLNDSAVEPLELIAKIKNGEETRNVKVLGYVSHVATELIQAAREIGCDTILARSAFSAKLPEILKQNAGERQGIA